MMFVDKNVNCTKSHIFKDSKGVGGKKCAFNKIQHNITYPQIKMPKMWKLQNVTKSVTILDEKLQNVTLLPPLWWYTQSNAQKALNTI
jgi:hypothetical protein